MFWSFLLEIKEKGCVSRHAKSPAVPLYFWRRDTPASLSDVSVPNVLVPERELWCPWLVPTRPRRVFRVFWIDKLINIFREI